MSATDGLEVIWYRLWHIWILGLIVIAATCGALWLAQSRREALAEADRLLAEKQANDAAGARALAAQRESVAFARRIADLAKASLALEAERSASAERERDSAESARLREIGRRMAAEASARRGEAMAAASQRRFDSVTQAERNRIARSQQELSRKPLDAGRVDPLGVPNRAVTSREAWAALAQLVKVKWHDADFRPGRTPVSLDLGHAFHSMSDSRFTDVGHGVS